MKPKLAILIPNFEGGGAQKVALTHIQALQERGYEITVIALEHQTSYRLPDNLTIHFLSQLSGHSSKLKKLLVFPLLPFRLAQLLKAEQISLCISHLERADFVNLLARPWSKHRTIGVIHSHLTATYTQEGFSFRTMIYLQLVKYLERFQTKLIAVSQGIKADLIQLGLPESKIQVILNPFEIERIQQLGQAPLAEYHQLFSSPILLSIGRLSAQKGLWHSIKAFQHYLSCDPKLKYVILGDGPLRQAHLDLAQKLGLRVYSIWDKTPLSTEYDLYFLGFQDNPFRFLARAWAFMLPSHYEGLPNVLVESLILGTPVIATDSDSGPRELLAPTSPIHYKTKTVELAEYGLLTPLPKNDFLQLQSSLSPAELALAEAIKLLNQDKQLYNSYRTKAKSRVREFRLKSIMNQWENLIAKLVE